MSKKVEIVDGKINFKCLQDKCPVNCCGPFNGINDSLQPLKEESFEGLLTKRDIKNMKKCGCEKYIEYIGNKDAKLKVASDGTCFFLKNGKCAMYKNRPQVCNAFPFYIDMFSGLSVVTGDCPGVGAGWTPIEELYDSIKDTTDVYELWIKKIRKDIKNKNIIK